MCISTHTLRQLCLFVVACCTITCKDNLFRLCVLCSLCSLCYVHCINVVFKHIRLLIFWGQKPSNWMYHIAAQHIIYDCWMVLLSLIVIRKHIFLAPNNLLQNLYHFARSLVILYEAIFAITMSEQSTGWQLVDLPLRSCLWAQPKMIFLKDLPIIPQCNFIASLWGK